MSIQAMKRTPLLSSLRTGLQQLGMATLATVVLASSVQAATDEFVYFHTDALGSPTAAFNEAGEVCWVETYSPYGEKLDKEDSLTPADGCGLLGTDVGYTGHVQDGSGLVYAQQRYYDPVIGRFVSTDPTMPHAGDPRYFGRYQYGGNNPYKYTDPNGEFLVSGTLAAIAVANIAWSAYDAYQTLNDESLTTEEKVETVATDIAVAAIGGAAGKLAHKIHKASKVETLKSRIGSPGGPKEGSSGGAGSGKDFSDKVKDGAREESNDTCVFCGVETIRSKKPHPRRSNIDHAHPKSRGGNNSPENAQNTCQSCNLDKGTETTEEYADRLDAQGGG